MNKEILLFSGGTGGHVIPAINFGNYLLNQGYNCSLILDNRGIKYSSNFNGKIYTIKSSHLTGNIFFKLRSSINLFLGLAQSLIIVNKIKPEKCLSFGSYATLMPLLATIILKIFIKIDIFIHEQNSVIGKVNSFILPYSKSIFTNFEDIINLDKKYYHKKIYVGTPSNIINKLILNKVQNNSDKQNIFIYGGSQGSSPLLNKFLLILKKLDYEYIKKIKLIIQSPKNLFESLNKDLKQLNVNYEISEFYYNIEEILSIANIAITRAGSGTINDLIKHQIPSIIMPLPNSIYNHQFFNAEYLFNKKAAILMDEMHFDIDSNLDIFKELITNESKRENMKEALSKIILPEANQIMLSKILYD